jgi:isopentenyldiphosphate isomerase
MAKQPHDPDEIIAVVDENDTIIGRTTRQDAHIKAQLHREVFCFVLNAKNEVLLQKRTDNRKWDISVGGHFPLDQTYDVAIVRECQEELGIKLPKSAFRYAGTERLDYIAHDGENHRFAQIFIVRKDLEISQFSPDPGEVSEVKYFSLKELQELLTQQDKTTTSLRILAEKYIYPLLAKSAG